MSICNIENGDCLKLMKELPDKSVDLFICDLPYGETNCAWDSIIDLEKFWSEFKRLRRSKRTACIHFCSTKFGYTLIKSWEKGYKMDMVTKLKTPLEWQGETVIWKKRNKTGGLQSRLRPMRNHEMVYFFYEQAPKYNRDKYHKRIKAVEPKEKKNKTIKANDRKTMGEQSGIYSKENQTSSSFTPPNPASIVEEKFCKEYYETNKTGMTKTDIYSKEQIKKYHKENGVGFEPPNPASVVEERNVYHIDKDKTHPNGHGILFKPPNPGSVVEEKTDIYGETKKERKERTEKGDSNFEPPNPGSVVDENEPVSMYESTKVFIGKRHHQTEKPLDILEFFLKYWTDEGDVVLDPTMGSGSTGVACKNLNRDFIGYEIDEKIFDVAYKRLGKKKNKVI